MVLPQLSSNIVSFERRRTNVLRQAFRAGSRQARASLLAYEEEQRAADMASSAPTYFTLTQVVDAFLGQADAGAYVVLARRITDSQDFDFNTGVNVEELEAKQNFFIVHKYLTETFGQNVSEAACANLILKVVVELYGEVLVNFPMSDPDRQNLESVQRAGSPLRTTHPTRKVGSAPTEINEELLREVPPSIRKVYEASAAWETAKKESKGSHQAGVLQAFSLM